MKRTAAFLLLAACGSAAQQAPTRENELGTSTHTGPGGVTHGTLPPPASDPGYDFRRAYQNPGGMWMPSQMTLPQHVEAFQKMGVKLDAKQLANPLAEPLAAVVSLGGCTASFVSPDGLIATNHHCAQGALEANSTPDHNYVQDGFFAKTQADELSAGPAQRVSIVQSYRDVTHDMRDGLDKIKDPVARKVAAEKRQKQLVAACEQDRPAIRCQVSSFFHGDEYQLIEMLELEDVRLVYAPARSIGDYGGEVDNWNWPRHTGDWSFFRAYVGKDGKPAEFATDNVPYRPAHWLRVSIEPLSAGDFVMITGFPGRTNRQATAAEVHHDLEWGYPYLISFFEAEYKIAEAHLKDGGETAIKATTAKQFIQNALEKYRGIVAGFQKTPDLIKQKDDMDQRTRAWAAQPSHEAYKDAIDKLDKLEAERFKTAAADFDRGRVFGERGFGGSRLLSSAFSFVRWAEERAKPDAARKPGFQNRDLPRALAAQKQLAHTYDRALDRDMFRLALVRALQLPEADRPWLATLLDVKKGTKIDEDLIDKTLAAWYGAPQLEDTKVRVELLEKGTLAKLRGSKDPFVRAALRLWPTVKAEETKDDAYAGELLLLAPMYDEAMKQMLGGALAPDANSTLRITYGTIKSLEPDSHELADGPFTTASQILAMDTGVEPFNAPKRLLDAIRAKQFGTYAEPALGGDLPVDFESDLDITGGNSGSPTLNARGELVGLAFDGNHEGLASDVVFNGATTRTISVDARYMIWVMDAVDGAHRLIKEMGLTPKFETDPAPAATK